MKKIRSEFFLPMQPPTVTHQEKQVHVVNGKPVFYEPSEDTFSHPLFKRSEINFTGF